MQAEEIQAHQAGAHVGSTVRLRGHVHALRKLGNLAFIVLRDRTGLLQLVVEDPALLSLADELAPESAIIARGVVTERQNSSGGVEMRLQQLAVLSTPDGTLPVEINKESRLQSLSLAAMLDYRPLTLRSPLVRAIFKIEAEFCAAFRQFLTAEGFTEIHSPKVVSTGTEGGAQLFKLDYFGQPADQEPPMRGKFLPALTALVVTAMHAQAALAGTSLSRPRYLGG